LSLFMITSCCSDGLTSRPHPSPSESNAARVVEVPNRQLIEAREALGDSGFPIFLAGTTLLPSSGEQCVLRLIGALDNALYIVRKGVRSNLAGPP
jgi:hypothetical protein